MQRKNTAQAIDALGKLADLWQSRLDTGWAPPESGAFPWVQVRLSLAALLPGMRDASAWVERGAPDRGGASPKVVTVVLAGNTPLLAWSPLCACLLAGAETVRVKLSREESVWTRRFVDDLQIVAPEVAARVELYDFPGADERTYALLGGADAVIAYGSDVAVTALQARTPEGIPFFGYGHAVSIGLYFPKDRSSAINYEARMTAQSFASDVLMYEQQGCLSPHIVYAARVQGLGRVAASLLGHRFAQVFPDVTDTLTAPPVTDLSVAGRIRTARDMAFLEGYEMRGDALRWTVIASGEPIPYPEPIGFGIIYVSPVESPKQLRELLQPVWGIVTCAGVAGELSPEWESVLREAGVSRICKPGEMQTPSLDWANGNRDLLTELLRLP